MGKSFFLRKKKPNENHSCVFTRTAICFECKTRYFNGKIDLVQLRLFHRLLYDVDHCDRILSHLDRILSSSMPTNQLISIRNDQNENRRKKWLSYFLITDF